ncbi:DoxX family protein [Geoalkalibacter sp.]|uniref:DoxX family protein n=1 Tax=Geoalkalibacter sp. TaxID=3041440 RepID=UPI00272E33C9|nr:DoxX family protein [Geoalkalibacter sp.]
MFSKLLHTENDYGALFVRLALGIVMFPHGAQKVLGWFGGYGFAGTMGFFTETLGLPYVVALLVVLAEFLGALGLIFGALTRIAALGIGSVMIGAIFMVHLPHGFFMNWSGNQAGEGFEFHLLAIGMSLALLIRGAGALSLDRWLGDKLHEHKEQLAHHHHH